ncbi:reverse transcriptase domain-containing protein [Tanacetum coccineum]
MSLTLFTLLFIFTATITATTTSPEKLIPTLNSKNITSVHLFSPTPETISFFSNTNISLLLTIPNSLIPSFSKNSNSSATSAWLLSHVTPFVPHVRISSISLGNNVTDANLLKLLLSGIDNVKEKVKGLGIKGVKVSTTVSLAFVNSKDIVAKELLGGLSEKDATLFVNVKHWNVSLGPFKEVVCCGFALKRDLSADVGYVSLDNNGEMMDYRVVEVRVLKVEEDKVKKDDDVDAILFLLILWIVCMLMIVSYYWNGKLLKLILHYGSTLLAGVGQLVAEESFRISRSGKRIRRHHDRRYAARGNGNEHRDPHDIAEIERLQERIRELELNQFDRYEGSTTDSVVREHTHDGFHNNFARRHPNREPATDPPRTLETTGAEGQIQGGVVGQDEAVVTSQVIARLLGALRPEISDVIQLQQYWSFNDVCRLTYQVEKQLLARSKPSTRPNPSVKPTTTPSTVQRGGPIKADPNLFTPSVQPGSSSGTLRCFKCQGLGHLKRDCPNKQVLAFVDETEPIYDTEPEEEDTTVIYPDRGEALVIQRLLHTVSVRRYN